LNGERKEGAGVVREADALREVFEVAGDRKGCAGEDHRPDAVIQLVLEQAFDVDRRGVEEEVPGARLGPVDQIGAALGLREELEVGAERKAAALDQRELLVSAARHGGAEGANQLREPGPLGLCGLERAAQERPAPFLRRLERHVEELAPFPHQARRQPRGLYPRGMGREALQGIAAELADAEAGELRAEVLGRDLLDRVGLVEHDGVVTRKHRRSGVSRRGGAQGQIGEEEMMVDDHYVGVRCLSPHAKDEAAIVVLALRSDALVRAGREIAPGSEVLRQVAQLGAVARLRRLRPGRDAVENRRFLPHRKGRIAQEAIEAEQAEVVLAAFQEGDLRVDPEGAQQGNVLVRELLLQRLRGRGDHHLEAAAGRRKQVRERLAGARARLDQKRPAVRERVLHPRRHRQLRGARLVTGQHPGERAARPEHLAQGIGHATVLPREQGQRHG